MKLRHLGTDYERSVDYYLDEESGKVYARRLLLSTTRKGEVDVAESKFVELMDGKEIRDPFPGVLCNEN